MLAQFTNLNAGMEQAAVMPSQQPVHAVLLIGLMLAVAALSRQAQRQHDLRICGQLWWLALLQATVAAVRLGEWLLGWSNLPALLACHAVVDLTIMGMFLYGLRRLALSGRVHSSRILVLCCLAAGALFWGLMGGHVEQPLLAANWIAVSLHLAFYLHAAGLLLRIQVDGWRASCEALRKQNGLLEQTNSELQREFSANVAEAEERARLHSELQDEAVGLRQRTRTLEKILAVAARLGATRNLSDLLDSVVLAVQDILGFRMVLLRLYSPSTQAFEARAFAGIPEEGKAHLTGIQVSGDDYQKLSQPRFRISNSYFLDHNDEGAVQATEGGYVPDLGPRAEGEWHEDDALIIPLINADGETKGYLSVDDPSDRRVPSLAAIRQIEFLARQAVTAIESVEVCDRLAKNNSELAKASEMINNLSEMKSNFIANVSHELRTPLTSITAYAEILQQDDGSMTEDVRREFLKVIHKESDKLSSIIDDILDLSRMQEGEARIEHRQTDLVAVAKRLGDVVCKRAKDKGIDFDLDVPADTMPLNADPMLLQQLLDHLLSNALKFTPSGGEARLLLRDHDESVEIVVEDTGIGIPEAKMRYIFDRFYQADGSATREHGGQGVGLSICQDIVRYHDGRIWAENRESGGSRFRVVLPRRSHVVQRAEPGTRSWAASDPAGFTERLIHWIAESLEVDLVSLMVTDDEDDCLVIQSAVGLPDSIVHSTRIRKGVGIAGKVWSSGRTLHVSDLTADARLGKSQNHPRYTTPSLLSVPLLDGLDVIGVVNVNNKRNGEPLTSDDCQLLESMAPRISHLLRRARDHKHDTRRFAELQEALRATIASRRERYCALTSICHQVCLATARSIKLPPEEMEHLIFALQCYDAGLSRIRASLLEKRDRLSPEERLQIQHHVAAGLEILAPLQVSSKVRQIILHHHERYDGKGYPDGLEGEAIPIGARLLALTDSLNAMLQDRPYRPRRFVDDAIAEIEALAGVQYCPRLTEPFLRELRERRDAIASLQTRAPAGDRAEDPALVTCGDARPDMEALASLHSSRPASGR